MNPREEKLPLWAREELARLRMRLDEMTKAANATLGPQHPASNLWLPRPGSAGVTFAPSQYFAGRVYVGPNMHVDFIELRLRDGRAEVYCNELMHLMPKASNVVEAIPAHLAGRRR